MQAFRLPLFAALALAVAMVTPAGAAIYKWVDEKGVTHYGEKAPKDTATEQVKVSDTTSSDADSEIDRLNKKRADDEAARKKAAGEGPATATSTAAGEKSPAQAKEDACAQNRKNLENLRSGKRVRVVGDDGQKRLLDDEAIAAQIKYAEDQLKNCEQQQSLQNSANQAPIAPNR